ncbi:uncharacterized protein LOC126970236 [Leptidea sinapis]|uniref:uncharacterized protein LOC126970236 n=1 Tax=Leptidea sinapis TaxID=189913 RepID=UPI0021C32059|nr:uncharacterized protein LOC126970236 [Leptidea sinapis]
MKTLMAVGLNEDSLDRHRAGDEKMRNLKKLHAVTNEIFNDGITVKNYATYFRHLLWWEELINRINLKKYNMFGVQIKKGHFYSIDVPGLAEKRPSLIKGDRLLIYCKDNSFICDGTISEIQDSAIVIKDFCMRFTALYRPHFLYNVRFMPLRLPMERMHEAVDNVFANKQMCRVFPKPSIKQIPVKEITRFYNPLIKDNKEQKSAVEHIVSGSSGLAPYIVFGPPGTGKTMTIVEAIVQIVAQSPRHRVMVCTDSNMAADHIALQLLQYKKQLNINNFMLRANSQTREWKLMPPALANVSNGTSFDTFFSVSNGKASTYRVLVSTLLHAAKYCKADGRGNRLQLTHLFIDEAGQASEPAALVPISGLLAPSGNLVLAGDPKQLGPVCHSKDAKARGLGTSLLERLKSTYQNMYESDPNYITMLINNFRSDPDILRIPNKLFYGNNLKPLAKPDELSKVSILGLPGGNKAAIFHAVHSHEQRMGAAPSFYNDKEIELVRKYVTALVKVHNVLQKDIGIIAPYIRQVYKIKGWLMSAKYDEIEVGTVESFQGKEKRVVIVSCVRANSHLLDYDFKYTLGFLVDDKRFTVAVTRAKAKLIIIGNPTCLIRDSKWREYMEFCFDNQCYFGQESQQMERNTALLTEIAKTRFERCRLADVLRQTSEVLQN